MRKAFKILAVTTLALTLALPFTAYASQWTQDAMGWKVQADDGIYLTNQWYQSPESGLFYYIGADGYMMVNTVTPDGYYVNAEGVWVEQPVSQPTQSKPVVNEPVQNNDTDDTLTPEQIAADEEFKRQLREAGKNGGSTDIVINPGEAGYDDSGEINIGGGY